MVLNRNQCTEKTAILRKVPGTGKRRLERRERGLIERIRRSSISNMTRQSVAHRRESVLKFGGRRARAIFDEDDSWQQRTTSLTYKFPDQSSQKFAASWKDGAKNPYKSSPLRVSSDCAVTTNYIATKGAKLNACCRGYAAVLTTASTPISRSAFLSH